MIDKKKLEDRFFIISMAIICTVGIIFSIIFFPKVEREREAEWEREQQRSSYMTAETAPLETDIQL